MRISVIRVPSASVRTWTTAVALAAGTLGGRPTVAQVVDGGTLVILSGGEVVGREEFTVRRGRTTGPGHTISTTAWYPATHATITLSFELELGADSVPTAVQLEVTGPDPYRLYAAMGTRRVTIRTVRPGREAARELPGAERHVVLDDSVFALQALLPRDGTPGFAGVVPRRDQRARAQVTWVGEARTEIGGVVHALQQVTLRLNGRIRHLWYDQGGRLMKAEDAGTGLVAERREGPR